VSISLRNDDPEVSIGRVSLSIVSGFWNDIEIDTGGTHHDHWTTVRSFPDCCRWHVAEHGAAGHERGNWSE
jgi:hypothetical protein